jgi:hypothetical protein
MRFHIKDNALKEKKKKDDKQKKKGKKGQSFVNGKGPSRA